MKTSDAISMTATAIIVAVIAYWLFPQKQPVILPPAPSQIATGVNASNLPDQTYTVRARIDALPSHDGRLPLSLHHEAIKDFVSKSGEVVGMKEMIMPFADLAPGVLLDGLKVDDPIEVTFEVRWKTSPRMLVTRIARLPEGTKLTIGKVLESGK